MKPVNEWSPQSLAEWHPAPLTLQEMKECEQHANAIMTYRANLPTSRPCWTEEWALGYLCAIRDLGVMNPGQWFFLCNAFQPQEGYEDDN